MDKGLQKRLQRLEQQAGRPVVVLVEWMLINLDPQVRRCARDLGLDESEVERVANATMGGATKSLSSGIDSVLFERQFRKGH